ncbi:MAG: hypothetical protein JWN31_1665 [Frankiales bacterium]|nr:hypothetical protein [Frankiales bacterium]
MTAPALVEVHMLGLPVPLAAKTRQHFEGLMREFELIAAGSSHGQSAHEVPVRLTQLVEALTGQFAGINTEADERLEDAIEAGIEEIEDHVLVLPIEAAEASVALGAMIDEADDYCRQGEHLLTLGSPPDCIAYREWYLGQVVGQLAGESPVAWPDSEPARRL